MDKASIKIEVPYAFSENPWTWFVLSIILLSSLSAFLYYRKEKIQEISIKEIAVSKLKNEKTMLHVQSILSAFNPHFINNSLHWVQSRNFKDPQITKMIGRLSANINYIFGKARNGQAMHSLKDELELVENYIIIQKLRFSNRFEYIGPDKKDIDKYKDVQVILMQIQIHVENAIEHGLRNRKNSTYVKVEISDDEIYYIISITDDGVGRKFSKKLKSRGNQSGIKMLREIYSIFNKNPKNKYHITGYYEDDIFQKDNIKFGTRVIIKIPKNFIYDINL